MQHSSPLNQRLACAHRFKLTDQQLHSHSLGIAREEFNSCSSGIAPLMTGPMVLTASPDWKALSVYSLRRWQQILPELWRLPKDNQLAKQFMVRFLGFEKHIHASEPLCFTTNLMNYARLDHDVMLLDFGQHHAEIWSDTSLSNNHKQT